MSEARDISYIGDSTAVLIHTLPPELIAEVFKLGRNMEDKFPNDTAYLSLITSVCSLWRNIALSTPELWTNIDTLTLVCKDIRKLEGAKGRLESFIARSKNVSLDVSIDLIQPRNSPGLSIIVEFVTEQLLPELSRCRFLAVRLYDAAQVESFFPLRGPLERLRHFSFEMGLMTIPRPCLPRRRFFEPNSAQGLREFQITGAGYETGFTYALSSVPFGTLRRLDLCLFGVNWNRVSEYLKKCPNVEDLTLEGLLLSHPEPPQSLSLQSLEKLTVTFDFLCSISKSVSTPRLKHLTIVPQDAISEHQNTPRHLSDTLHTVTLRGMQVNYLACISLSNQANIRVIIMERIQTFDPSTNFDPLFARLLGIAGEPHQRASWEAYVPAKPSFLLNLELLEIRGGIWGGGPHTLAPAVIRLLNLRPKLRIKINALRWELESHIDPLRAVESQYAGRFVFSIFEL